MYTLGIEQEFYLLDAKNHDLVFLTQAELNQIFGNSIKQETYRCQIEINTPICLNINDLKEQHQILLTNLYQRAQQHGLLVLNASTLPHVKQDEYFLKTPGKRYKKINQSIQKCLENFICCSIQFHVQTAHLNLRYPLINHLRTYLPIFLALSTSSPFWQGQITGLKSYRAQILQSIPNQGLPPDFENMNDFNKFTKYLKQSGIIQSCRELWWDLRPHSRYPTLECRICDNVLNPRDAIAISALFQALVYKMEQDLFQRLTLPKNNWFIDQENRWSAARYGLEGQFIDIENDAIIDFRQAVLNLIQYAEDSMLFFNSQQNIKEIIRILDCGTSADQQLNIYNQHHSLNPVIDFLTTFQ